jgi:hypothetical protein
MKIVDEVPPRYKDPRYKDRAKYVLLATVGDTRNRWCHTSLVRAKSARSAFMKSWYYSHIPHCCVLADFGSEQDKDFLARMNEDMSV